MIFFLFYIFKPVLMKCIFRTMETKQFVTVPSAPFFCNLVVFPSPYADSKESWFFLLKNSAVVPIHGLGSVTVPFLPSSVYCFLPSIDENIGTVSFLLQKPSFLKDYTYALEINKQAVYSQNESLSSHKGMFSAQGGKVSSCEYSTRCDKCFISNSPSPNSFFCKWKHYNC